MPLSRLKDNDETKGAVMKVFVAGATGVLGRVLVPQLVARGHDVVGMTRSASKQDLVRSLGARPVVADALDPDAVTRAVASAEPEVIVHQLTALSGEFDMRHIDRFFETTNRLRTEGTDHLLAAARAVGARRFVAQSYAGWPAARTGGPVKSGDARRVLRPRNHAQRRPRRRPHRRHPQAPAPRGRRRRRDLVLHPRRGRRGGDR